MGKQPMKTYRRIYTIPDIHGRIDLLDLALELIDKDGHDKNQDIIVFLGDYIDRGPNSFEVNGLKVEILKEGTGVEAKVGDTVTVNYVGYLENGTKFDSSIDRNAPFTFPIGQERVIKGFDSGVVGMKFGEKRKLVIPPALGYGSTALTLIPANSTLVYDIEMLKITK